MPTNRAFQRVCQTCVFDPKAIGDKAKWFAKDLDCIRFTVWDDQSSLAGILRGIKSSQREEPDTGKDKFTYPFSHNICIFVLLERYRVFIKFACTLQNSSNQYLAGNSNSQVK